MSKQSFFFHIPILKLMNYSYMDDMHPACNELKCRHLHVQLPTNSYSSVTVSITSAIARECGLP